MRRSEFEVTDRAAICEILNSCKVCRVAVNCGGAPYIFPMSFGYRLEGEKFIFSFHCAESGKKLDLLKEAGAAAFEADVFRGVVGGTTPCSYGCDGASVIASGKVSFITDEAEKIRALNDIMLRQVGREFDFGGIPLGGVTVFEIRADEICGKDFGRKN